MSNLEASTSQHRSPLDLRADPDADRPFFMKKNTFLTIQVEKPMFKLVGKTQVAFYEVVTPTNYEGFNPRTAVMRRYSDFHLLRKALVAKGGYPGPPSLSWFEWIPRNLSGWEELNDWVAHLKDVRYVTNKDCLDELRRFFNDKSTYQTPLPPLLIHRLFQ